MAKSALDKLKSKIKLKPVAKKVASKTVGKDAELAKPTHYIEIEAYELEDKYLKSKLKKYNVKMEILEEDKTTRFFQSPAIVKLTGTEANIMKILKDDVGGWALELDEYNEMKENGDGIKPLNSNMADGGEVKSKEEVEKILKELGIRNYTINDDLTVDVDGNVDITKKELSKIPVNFNKVSGDFMCYYNKLISLKGCPIEVGGDFNCHTNQLTTLEGGPKIVKGDNYYCKSNKLMSLKGAPEEVKNWFTCSKNELTTLEGGPKIVKGFYDCYENKLTSLKGSPKIIGQSFDCSENKLTSLKDSPEIIKKDFKCNDNQLTTLEGGPKKVGKDYIVSNNKLKSLKEVPEEIKGSLYCENNQLTTLEDGPKKVKRNLYCLGNPLTTLNGAPKEIGGKFQYKLVNEKGGMMADGGETFNADYWQDYYDGDKKYTFGGLDFKTDVKNSVQVLVKNQIKKWNEDNDDNVINVLGISDSALKFVGKKNYISNSIIDAMIMQEGSDEMAKGGKTKLKGLDYVIENLGENPSNYKIANFVYRNYDKVTGLKKSMRNEEMDFPSEIYDVINHYKLDINEFTENYSSAAEGYEKGGELSEAKMIQKLTKQFEGKDLWEDEILDDYEVKMFDFEQEEEMEKWKNKNSKKNYIVPFNSEDDSHVLILVPKNKMEDGGEMKEGFKNTKDFEKFLEEIDGMGEFQIKKIMGEDYIETPGFYSDEKDDYDDVIDFMTSNMGKSDFEKLKKYWETKVSDEPNYAKGGELSEAKMIQKLTKQFEGKDLWDDEILDEYEVKRFNYEEFNDEENFNKWKRSKEKKNYIVPFDSQDDSYIFILVPKNKMKKGGETEEEDLFYYYATADYEKIPQNVQVILRKYDEAFIDGEYSEIVKAKKELNKIGYTFDIDSTQGGIRPENLRKMAKGGYMAKGGETIKKINDDLYIYKKLYILPNEKFGWMIKKNINKPHESGYAKTIEEAIRKIDIMKPPLPQDVINFKKELKNKFPNISLKVIDQGNYLEAIQGRMVITWWFNEGGDVQVAYYERGEYHSGIDLGVAKTAEEAVALAEPEIKNWNYIAEKGGYMEDGGMMADGGETKVAKFKVEDMVYSYQNKDYAAPINYVKFNPWDSNSGTHPNDTYKYRLSLKDGHSNWIDEKSLYKTKQKEYADGGTIAQENNDMLQSNIKEIKHHADELKDIVTNKTKVEPWVIAKTERASTDLSDVTHYLDGEKDKSLEMPFEKGGYMAKGGEIKVGDSIRIKDGLSGKLMNIEGENLEVKKITEYPTFNGVTKFYHVEYDGYIYDVREDKIDYKRMEKNGYMSSGGMMFGNSVVKEKIDSILSSNTNEELNSFIKPVKFMLDQAFAEDVDIEMIEYEATKEMEFQLERSEMSNNKNNYKELRLIFAKIKAIFSNASAGFMAKGGYMADGGEIENQYKNLSPEEIWSMWNEKQRVHFLRDHKHEFPEIQDTPFILRKKEFKKLPARVQIAVEFHTEDGEYAMGGKLSSSATERMEGLVPVGMMREFQKTGMVLRKYLKHDGFNDKDVTKYLCSKISNEYAEGGEIENNKYKIVKIVNELNSMISTNSNIETDKKVFIVKRFENILRLANKANEGLEEHEDIRKLYVYIQSASENVDEIKAEIIASNSELNLETDYIVKKLDELYDYIDYMGFNIEMENED